MSLVELEEKIPVIRASGSNYDIGLAHGIGGKREIDITLANLKKSVQTTVGHVRVFVVIGVGYDPIPHV